jgi:hypothetical protein
MVARWYIFIPKNMALLDYVLITWMEIFSLFHGHWVILFAILEHFPLFGLFQQETSGNPERE